MKIISMYQIETFRIKLKDEKVVKNKYKNKDGEC